MLRRGWAAVQVPLLVALAACCLPRSSSAAITVDTPNISSATATGVASLTWSHTIGAGANRILIVGTSLRGNEAITGVAYGGTSLTPIGSVSNGIQNTSALWYLLAPPQGTADVVVTLTGNVRIVGGAVTFFGIDQVTPLGTYVSARGTSATASVTATSATGQLVIDTVAANGNAGITVGGGQTERWNRVTGATLTDLRGGGSTENGAASVLMSWGLGAVRTWAIGAVPLRPVPLSGRVFEDVNYGGGAGRSQATASGVPCPGAQVELYDGAGNFVSLTTSDASGGYSFSGIAAGNYTVRVVNATVASSRAGYVAGLLPVQTYRTNASTGAAVPVTNYVGGQNPTVVDAGAGSAGTVMNTATGVFTVPAALAGQTAQSFTNVTLGGGPTDGVDFGFNFDTIVNVNSSGQGSLRQFILNSNALGGEAALAQSGSRRSLGVAQVLPAGQETSIFMISDGAAHAGLRAGITNQLTAGVAVIRVTGSAFPALAGANAPNTVLDGTTQTQNVGDTNPGEQGTGGTVGVSALPLIQIPRPEVEIRNGGAFALGLSLDANALAVRGIAVWGFGGDPNNSGNANIEIENNRVGALIEQNYVGTTAVSFADPGASRTNGSNVRAQGADNGTLRNNLVGFARGCGFYAATNGNGWLVEGNEFQHNGWTMSMEDGIALQSSSAATVRGNLVYGNEGVGIDLVNSSGGHTIQNNTVHDNGTGSGNDLSLPDEWPGIRLYGTGNLVDRNVVYSNYGAGVMVTSSSTGNLITRNSIYANGTILNRIGAGPTGQLGIDLLSASDSQTQGTSPFYTLNDAGDGDTGGNGLLNFPVLTWATLGQVPQFRKAGCVVSMT